MTAKQKLEEFESQLPLLNILVIGDLMLDRYLWGSVARISPEAPVPVVEVSRSENRLGGAANVGLNIAGMGAQVALSGAIGEDEEGTILMKRIVAKGFDTKLILRLPKRPTTTKTRVIGNNQQMLRVDREVREPLSASQSESLRTSILKRLDGVDAIIFEDYDKGVLSEKLIAAVIAAAREKGIPTIVDPKYRNFLAYHNCTIFKPNLKELNEALNVRLDREDLEGIVAAVNTLRTKMPHNITVITLSENGILTVDEKGRFIHVPAHLRKITDVSGAGDTVVALLGLAMAAGMSIEFATRLANLGGGLVCEEVGVVSVERERLLSEARSQLLF